MGTYLALMPHADYWVPTCDECGALVVNATLHADWHAAP